MKSAGTIGVSQKSEKQDQAGEKNKVDLKIVKHVDDTKCKINQY